MHLRGREGETVAGVSRTGLGKPIAPELSAISGPLAALRDVDRSSPRQS